MFIFLPSFYWRIIYRKPLRLQICFVLSVFGWMGPIAAAMLHTMSTLVIIFNSARLLRAGEEITSMNVLSWRRNLQLQSAKE